jgi:hypothetical protein
MVDWADTIDFLTKPQLAVQATAMDVDVLYYRISCVDGKVECSWLLPVRVQPYRIAVDATGSVDSRALRRWRTFPARRFLSLRASGGNPALAPGL